MKDKLRNPVDTFIIKHIITDALGLSVETPYRDIADRMAISHSTMYRILNYQAYSPCPKICNQMQIHMGTTHYVQWLKHVESEK